MESIHHLTGIWWWWYDGSDGDDGAATAADAVAVAAIAYTVATLHAWRTKYEKKVGKGGR